VTPLHQLRFRLPDHNFDRLMQAVKHIASPERDAPLKYVAAGRGKHEVVGAFSVMISLISAAERSPPQG
jgi:hypothetical protein